VRLVLKADSGRQANASISHTFSSAFQKTHLLDMIVTDRDSHCHCWNLRS